MTCVIAGKLAADIMVENMTFYMLKNKMINHSTYIKNVTKRLIIQKLMPNKLRGWVFRTFARKKVS